MRSDYFHMLGLERRFSIDPAELERRYLERSREVHPDRLAGRPADERAAAAGQAMQLNQAYRALKRELPRAEHLLQLAGVEIGDNEPVKQDLLIEMLELREEQAKARAAGDGKTLGRLESDARQRERAELDRLRALFAASEGSGDDPTALERIKDQVIRLRYLARYREAFEDAESEAHGVPPSASGAGSGNPASGDDPVGPIPRDVVSRAGGDRPGGAA